MENSFSNKSNSKTPQEIDQNDKSEIGNDEAKSSNKHLSREVEKENHDRFTDNEAEVDNKNDIVITKKPLIDDINNNLGESSEESGNDVEVS